MRTFDTGATRNSDDNRYDYEGFIDPAVLEVYGEYMHRHRTQSNGALRDSDNWQKGIPITQYMKSLLRHVFTMWRAHRKGETIPHEEACAVLFNTMGILHEQIKKESTAR